MKLFFCPACRHAVFFENVFCERCRHTLGYEPDANQILALEQAEGGIWTAVGASQAGTEWKFCSNYQYGVCNWLVEGDSPDRLCRACRHNLTIPSLANPRNLELWGKIERAKHRLFYTLLRLGLPLTTRQESEEGLGFEFLDADAAPGDSIMTGHDHGLITIALAEADDAEREKRRTSMGEPYRTLLGHFRHEIGHWYWDRLVRDGGRLEECRALFGDDTVDYGEALKAHYAQGPRPDWQDSFVSAYAGAHAWEDFAETWAHYFHIIDTLNTGGNWGISIHPRIDEQGLLATNLDFAVHDPATTIEQITSAWLPLAAALNSFNRSMGHQDLYPFVLSPAVIVKLGFIHDLVHGLRRTAESERASIVA